jgi:hypothetical protein
VSKRTRVDIDSWPKPLLLGLGLALFLIVSLSLLVLGPGAIVSAGARLTDQAIALTIGTLPRNKTVTLTFDVTVGDVPTGTNQIANQGQVSGSNFTSTLTDDPSQPGTTDPTLIVAQPGVLPRFTFRKTVGIAGILPTCTASGTVRVPVNTTVIYCYTVRNTGSVPFTRHTLVDNRLGTLLNGVSHPVAPGASFSHTVTATLSVSTTNLATWTVSNPSNVAAALAVPADIIVGANTSATVIISAAADDQDGDTIPDNMESAADVDRDNVPNFLDTDADNDGKPDQVEAGPDPTRPRDSNGDGIPDFLDARPTATDPDDEPSQLDKRIYLPLIQHR